MSNRRATLSIFVLLLVCVPAFGQGRARDIERARRIHRRYRDHICALPEVQGSAVGLGEQDQPVIHIMLRRAGVPGIPRKVDGLEVRPIVTGRIYALASGWGGSWRRPTYNSYYYSRPVPIGVSTGNVNEQSAGTIACRLIDGSGNVFALSNNHVYAMENDAGIGDIITQPGMYDTKGVYNADYFLGYLDAYCTIDFSEDAENVIDAAIAITDTKHLGNRTPSGGYGLPRSQPIEPEDLQIGQYVMKYGRTSRLTYGRIYALDATVQVEYASGVARFVDQIVITPGRFCRSGDSGSLVVSYPDRNPVGLLFAGSSSVAVANPITNVLEYFGVEIDGED